MTRTYTAVDLGATSGRVLTGQLIAGELHTEEVARFDNTPVSIPGHGGRVLHWDVLRLWHGVLEGIAAAHRIRPVTSIGVDTWAVDYGLLDTEQVLLGNPVHYRDGRTMGMPERFFAAMSPRQHYTITGAQVQPFNTVFQLLAEGARAQRDVVGSMLLIPDLLTYWLTGEQTAEVTNASTTGLLDVSRRQWSPDVLQVLDHLTGRAHLDLLAPLTEPSSIVGSALPEHGWGRPLVVAVGSHDTASAVAAVPMADPEHAAYISSGTWSLVGVERRSPVLSEASRVANVTNELGVDGTVRYLKNVAGLWLVSESIRTWRNQGKCADLPRLLGAAVDVPACRTVIDVDDPVFATPGDIPARIAHAARSSGQAVPEDEGAITRCILDSLALAYRRAVRAVAELSGHAVRVVHVVGGGSRNRLLCQLTADATGLPVLAGPAEGTAMGNLLVQAWALGDLDGGLPAIRRVVAASTELIRWTPAGDAKAWDQAEDRLRDISAARQ